MCCPRVKRFEWDTSTTPATLKAVEFHPPYQPHKEALE